MLRSLSVMAALAIAAPSANAQGTSQVSTQGNAPGVSCEDASLRVNGRALPQVGSQDWNDWVTLTGCGSRGATIIAGTLRSDAVRTETELTRLDHLTGLLDGWFQPSLVSAYEWLLRAPGASNGVRLRAMWLLSGLYVPDVDVAGPLQGFMSARCETYERTTDLREAPNTLPAEAYDQARAAVMFAADNPSSPEYVRTTARCWERVIADGLANGTREVRQEEPVQPVVQPVSSSTVIVNQPTTVVVEHPVRVVYDCGTRFVFYNDAGYDLAVRYDGYGAGMLRVAAGGPFVWVAGRFGPVRFWLGEREIWYTNAVYRPCGPRFVVGPAIYPWRNWHAGLGVFVNVNVGPRVIVTRPSRPSRPVIIVNRPRGGDNRRNDGWNDRNDRNDRNDHYDRNDRDDRDARNSGGRVDRNDGYRSGNGSRNAPPPARNEPRRDDGGNGRGGDRGGDRGAEPRGDGGSRSGGAQPIRSAIPKSPIPFSRPTPAVRNAQVTTKGQTQPAPEQKTERTATPKGGKPPEHRDDRRR